MSDKPDQGETTALIERVARAICKVNGNDPDQLWNPQDPKPSWMLYVEDANAAIHAMENRLPAIEHLRAAWIVT
jgi:hypothetical protein